ncbi:MAG: hypothetical protein JO045_04635 [Mycobacterium sp.]|nr:hypothetical protein [Mycobacterium sp.]
MIYRVMSGIPSVRRTRFGGTMVATAADNPVRGGSPATPAITVTPAGIVIGADFLPGHDVTVRITRSGEDVSDYLTYTADRNGYLYADLPATALTGMLRIAATDHRPDPDGACGRLWSNTYTLSA